jgi:transglutaminase-like putative cysteine protease
MPWELFGLIPGDNGITQTANAIRQAVFYAIRNSPSVRLRAELLTSGLPARDEYSEVNAVFSWVLRHYRYLRDPRGLELVKSPEVSDKEISERGAFQGDCDDVAAYLAALLSAIGYRVKLVVMSVPNRDGAFRHIYIKVFLPKQKRWLPLEATAPQKPAGWSAPSDRIREYPLF